MKKPLAVMLALCICLGVPFSGALKAVFGVLEGFDDSLTKVGDTFGVDLFSGVGDNSDESETTFGLGYYEFDGDRRPLWEYIKSSYIPFGKFENFLFTIESVNPNVFWLEDNQSGVFYSCVRIRFVAVNPLTPFSPFRGYMYLDLDNSNEEYLWISSSHLIPAKKVNVSNGYTFNVVNLLFAPHTATVSQDDETISNYILSNILN